MNDLFNDGDFYYRIPPKHFNSLQRSIFSGLRAFPNHHANGRDRDLIYAHAHAYVHANARARAYVLTRPFLLPHHHDYGHGDVHVNHRNEH